MARLHLFEFLDQSWLPATLRAGMTGYLDTVSRVLRLHDRLAAPVQRALDDSGTSRIIDLCSGSGGPILEIQPLLDPPTSVLLTDRFPPGPDSTAGRDAMIDARLESVDARRVPPELRGLRTVVNALHHFRPSDARRVLADAVENRAPVLVIEIAERTILNVVASPLIVLMVFLVMPFVRPWRWQYLIFTYVLPVLPVLTFWDGLVPHLRAYSTDELMGLAGSTETHDYRWRVERVPLGGGLRATLLTGLPVSDAAE